MYLSEGVELCLKVDGVVYSVDDCQLFNSEQCECLEMFAYGIRSAIAHLRRKEVNYESKEDEKRS